MAPPRPHRCVVALVLALGAAALLAGPSWGFGLSLPVHFFNDTICTELVEPTGMALLPDGRLLVTEKTTARVRLSRKGVLATEAVLTVPEVEGEILEQGLLGIAVDPGWPARPYIYVHYTHSASAFVRISRFTVSGDLTYAASGNLSADPASRYDILSDLVDNTPFHNGGSLRFGPDGMLYDAIGDDYAFCPAQDLTALSGKILRLDISRLPAGGGGPPPKSLITPADNPFVTHPNENARLVCHYGLRNPFKFAIDPVTGDMLIGDVGEASREEINVVSGFGMNFQWPIYEGDLPGPRTCAGVDSTSWVPPIHAYDHTLGAAVNAAVIYRAPPGASTPFPPEYEGDVFFADTYGDWVARWGNSGGVWAPEPAPGQPNPTDWATWPGVSSFVDWLIAPDGSLYCIHSYHGEVRRIWYRDPDKAAVGVPGSALPPIALRAPYPSPSRGETTFEYALTGEEPVSLTILDVAGRTIRTLVRTDRGTPGGHRATWDGRDAAGRRAPAGIYRARLNVAGRILERRLSLVD